MQILYLAAQISFEEKCTIYTHCYGHSLNLAVRDCIKKCRVCSDALDAAFEIKQLIKFSPKRDSALSDIREESEEECGPEIRNFVQPGGLYKEILYRALTIKIILKQLWSECLETLSCLDPDFKRRLIGV